MDILPPLIFVFTIILIFSYAASTCGSITFGYRSTLSKTGRTVLTFISTKFASVLVICIDTLMIICFSAYHQMLTPPRSLNKYNICIYLVFFIKICRDTKYEMK